VASFTLTASIAAPVEVVFDVVTDHRGQADMTALRSSILEREGDHSPNGVGAIRNLTLLGLPIREQVTVFERPHQFAYKMLSGVPVRSHVGTVELTQQNAATILTWQIDSIPKLPTPAAVWSGLVRPAINMLLKGVKKESRTPGQLKRTGQPRSPGARPDTPRSPRTLACTRYSTRWSPIVPWALVRGQLQRAVHTGVRTRVKRERDPRRRP
jgi:hypothetical protein